MSAIATLSSAFATRRNSDAANFTDLSTKITDAAIDPSASIDGVVAAVRASGVTKTDLDAIVQNLMTGSGTFADTNLTTRGRLAKVISRVIDTPAAFAPAAPVMRERHPTFQVPVTTLPIPEAPKAGVTIRPEDVSKITETDRKYMDAIEAAGIAADLTGNRNTLTAGTLAAILEVAENTPGLSVREFLIDVVVESPALGFEGITAGSFDNAAAVLLAAADKQRAIAEKAGNDTDVATLTALVDNTVNKNTRSKAQIAEIYRGVDAIFARDPSAAAPELRTALASPGGSLKGRYDFHLSYDAKVLIADPHIETPQFRTRGATRGAVVSEESAVGGRSLQLVDDTFATGRWEQKTLRQLVDADPRFRAVADANRFDLDAPRDVLVVTGREDPHPIYIVFSKAGDGVLTVCKDCAFHPFKEVGGFGGGGGGPIMVRKPVIYIYPQTAMTVRVKLEVQGKYVAQYPKMNRDDGWEVRAEPNGDLMDPRTEKTYPYLFWEAERAQEFVIDETKASMVARESVVDFLDKMASAYKLTARERTDFVTYWMAPMQANAFSMVQFLDVDYTSYAKMTVTPQPDSVIRMFMVFKAATGLERVGNPSMPTIERRGFTVVEWGGANLDERVGG